MAVISSIDRPRHCQLPPSRCCSIAASSLPCIMLMQRLLDRSNALAEMMPASRVRRSSPRLDRPRAFALSMGCFQSLPLPPPNREAIDLTHFIICRVLGRGGFGKVNAVQRQSDNQYFAMKTIEKHRLFKREQSFALTWLERWVMCSTQSPFLVTCLHAFQDEHYLYMVMPLLLGGDLRFYLRQNGPCKESEARFFMVEILLGLEALHSLNCVYRDLKPDNVLLDSDGHVRISDFGLTGRSARWTANERGTAELSVTSHPKSRACSDTTRVRTSMRSASSSMNSCTDTCRVESRRSARGWPLRRRCWATLPHSRRRVT